MSAQKPKSFQDILKKQRRTELREEFVGRGEEVRLFRANLALQAEERRFVCNVQGQGGVGKTFLLRHFVQLAEEQRFLTSMCSDDQRSVVDVLAKVSEDLRAKGVVLKSFDARYEKYRQKRAELEADPELPAGSFELLGRAAIRASLWAGAQAVGAGVIAPLINPDEIGSKVGEVVAFFAKKLKTTDDVQLVREPIAVLTPLWLKELRDACDDYSIILFFDVYERCAEFLDEWLRDLLNGRYGETPLNLLFVVAGQTELPRVVWRDFETTVSRMTLEPFTEEETRAFLQRKGVTEPQVVADMFRITRGLPVVLDLLVDVRPGENSSIDPRSTAIEHFLKGVEPRYRQISLNAALPRWLNRDVMAELTGGDGADDVFDWLKQRPFVLGRSRGREYHPVVRHLMLAHKHHESPDGSARLHRKLGEYYARLQEQLELAEARRLQDASWREYALEVLYHQMCGSPRKCMTSALEGFLLALKYQVAFARDWAETLREAEEDTQLPAELRWGARLANALKHVAEDRFAEAIPSFTALLGHDGLRPSSVAIAFNWRGHLHAGARLLEEAFADHLAATNLVPDETAYFLDRGRALFLLQRHEEAIKDLTHVIEREPDAPGPYVMRCFAFLRLNRQEEATKDIDKVVALSPQSSMAVGLRFLVSLQRGDQAQALADFEQIASRAPQYVQELQEAIQTLAPQRALDEIQFVFSKMGLPLFFSGPELQQQLSVMEDLSRGDTAPMIAALQAGAAAFQAHLHKHNANLEQALAAIEQAVTLDPTSPLLLMERAELRGRMGREEEAREDADRAVAMAPTSADVLKQRGSLHMSWGRNKDAIADFSRAIELKPDDVTFLKRCILHRMEGHHAEALADLERAIALSPDNVLMVFYRVPLQVALRDPDGVVATYTQLAANAEKFVTQLKFYAGKQGWEQRGVSLQNLISAMGFPPMLAPDLLERLKAIVEADEATGVRAVQADAAANEARIHVGRAALPEALASIDRAVTLEPDSAAHRCMRADVYRRLGRPENAIADLDSLRESSEARIHVIRGALYLQLHQHERALVAADRALALQPGIAVAHGIRGEVLGMQRRYAEALEETSRALELDTNLSRAFTIRIRLFWALRRYAEALADLDTLAARAAWLIRDLPNERGELLTRLGQHVEAEVLYRQVLTEKPDDWRAAYNLVVTRAWLEGASTVSDDVAEVLGRLQGARATGGAAVLVRLAGLEALTDSPDRAFELLNEALASDPHLVHWVTGDLAWSGLQGDARFQALLESAGGPAREQ